MNSEVHGTSCCYSCPRSSKRNCSDSYSFSDTKQRREVVQVTADAAAKARQELQDAIGNIADTGPADPEAE